MGSADAVLLGFMGSAGAVVLDAVLPGSMGSADAVVLDAVLPGSTGGADASVLGSTGGADAVIVGFTGAADAVIVVRRAAQAARLRPWAVRAGAFATLAGGGLCAARSPGEPPTHATGSMSTHKT